jgi:hypothetical protein
MKKFKLILLLTILFINSSATASTAPTKTWMDACDSKSNHRKVCMGYFSSLHNSQDFAYLAAIDSYRNMLVILNREEIIEDPEKFSVFNKKAKDTAWMLYGCIQEKSVEQMMAVFVKWAEENPSKWHLPISESITESLVMAFPPPCE